ncbi:MAG: thioesterase family protein [Hydrogenophilaceae bacterium]|jgi:hypothetical protein|nr:thioesterase family protein [Hydrogenophilaceae bacterium]
MPHTTPAPDAALSSTNAFYRLDGAIAHPSPDTRGPWDPNAQHGGAPTALIAWTVDRMASAVPMRIARITVDLFRPVPIAPLEVRTAVLREGRNIQLVEARLVADGKECVRAAVLRVRDAAVETPLDVRPPPQRWPAPDDCPRIANFAREGLAQHLDIRPADGRMRDRNGSPVWFRLRAPFIEGERNTPLIMAAITADFCNGMSGVLDWEQWTFINADLTIHFARDPIGEWMMLEAHGWVGADGRGTAFGVLSDVDGTFGRAAQSLVIAPRR